MNKLINNFLNIFKKQDVQRFLLMGLLSNAINFFVYYALVNINISLSLSSILGYLSGLVCSYHLGRVWVFGHIFKVTQKKVMLFISVYTLGSIWMIGTINILVVNFGFDFKLAWFFGAVIAIVNNFLGSKFFVFKLKGG